VCLSRKRQFLKREFHPSILMKLPRILHFLDVVVVNDVVAGAL